MELSISQQLTEALAALIIGVSAGVLYDIFRILRVRLNSPSVTFVTDVLFGVICGLALFLTGMTTGGGRQRIFSAVIAFLGGAVYFGTLSRFVRLALRLFADVLAAVLGFLARPFVFAFGLLKKLFIFFKTIFQKAEKWCRIKHHGVKVSSIRRKRRVTPKKGTSHETQTHGAFHEDPADRAVCIRGHYHYPSSLGDRAGRS